MFWNVCFEFLNNVYLSYLGYCPSIGVTPTIPFANGYNRWTTNSDDAESADITEIDGGIMEGVRFTQHCHHPYLLADQAALFVGKSNQ